MKNFLILSIITLLISTNLIAKDNSPQDANKFVFGKLIVKLKPQVQVSQNVNDEINSDVNFTEFGINSIDKFLSGYKIKDIDQKFPYHNNPEFRAQMSAKVGTQIQTLENIYEINFDQSIPVEFLVNKLRKLPEVEYAEPVYVFNEYDVPNDEKYSVMQHLPQIMASEAWDMAKGEDGAEVVVGICDSGVEWYHPDLLDNLKQNLGEDYDGDGVVVVYNESEQKWEFDPDDVNGIDDDGNGFADDFIGWNFSYYTDNTPMNSPDVTPVNSHGTHVAGLAAGGTNNETGIAAISWNVKYLPTKHGNNLGGTSIYSPYEGIVYLAENGADIINMSWGGSPFSYYGQDVMSYAASMGCILVAAAGNDNTMNPHFPSAYCDVISVASVASTDAKSYYSTYGGTVDISAPGGDRYVDGGVWSTIPEDDYAKYQGTSMASPVAAGLFALVKSYYPEKSNDELIAQVIGTTDDISALNPNYENMLGTGRINAYRAVSEDPMLDEGLKLTVLNAGVYTYDPEYDDYFFANIVQPNSEGYLQLVVKNSNNFFGDNLLVVNITSDNPDFMLSGQNFSQAIGPDESIQFDIPFTVDEMAQTGYVNFEIDFYSTENEIAYGSHTTYQLFLNAGGVLVWEPVPNTQDMSSNFFKEYYENMGVEVYYTNEILPTFEGFDAVFCSYGNTYAPDYDDYYMSLYFNLINMLNYSFYEEENANIFFESQNFLSHYNPNVFGFYIYGMYFGLGGWDYDPEVSTPVENVMGVPDNYMFNDFMFATSSQENSYETDRLIPDESSTPLLEIPEFGNVMNYGINMFGSQVITSSISVSQLDDESCPSTRENLMRRLNLLFGIYAEPMINLTDVSTCTGVPVSIGSDAIECADDFPIVDFVTGGSGYYDWEWVPAFGLDDEYAANPTVLDPQITRTYTLQVYDVFLEEYLSKNILVTVNSGATARVPLFRVHPANTPINLNEQINSVTGGVEPYQAYIWTDMYGEPVDPENEIPNLGLNRYYLTVVDANGCESRPARMIVYVSMYKQLDENDVVAGENGTSVLASYPNPTTDNVNVISVFEDNVNTTIKIIDLNGNTVYTMNRSSVNEINETINVSGLATGTYFIIVDSEDDTVMKKFIKQ